jgi:ParB family chromosome partitioning protein
VDEALAYRRLQEEFGLTQDEVSERVGKSRVSVANGLRLLQLPPDMLADVSRGTLSAGHARAILAVKDDDGRLDLWKRIKEDQLSVRAAEDAARRSSDPSQRRSPRASRKPATVDPQVAYLEDRLRQVLGTQVKIATRGKGGRIELDYYDDADLERILALLGAGDEL